MEFIKNNIQLWLCAIVSINIILISQPQEMCLLIFYYFHLGKNFTIHYYSYIQNFEIQYMNILIEQEIEDIEGVLICGSNLSSPVVVQYITSTKSTTKQETGCTLRMQINDNKKVSNNSNNAPNIEAQRDLELETFSVIS